MSQLSSKTLLLQNIAERVKLAEYSFFFVYYTPSKMRLKVQVAFQNYKPFSLYKRAIKHSAIPLVLKNHFAPGLGILKFDSLSDIMAFLKEFKTNISRAYPYIQLVNVFFRNRHLFFSNLNIFLQFQNVIKDNNTFFLRFYSSMLLALLRMLFSFKKCMLFSFLQVKKNAYT